LRHEQRRLFLVILGEVRPLLAPRLLAVAGPVPDLAAIAATILVGGTISAVLAGALRLPPWLAAPPPPPLRETEEPSPCFLSRRHAAHCSSVSSSWPPAVVRAGASVRSSTAL